jgi:hypothetical protein
VIEVLALGGLGAASVSLDIERLRLELAISLLFRCQ